MYLAFVVPTQIKMTAEAEVHCFHYKSHSPVLQFWKSRLGKGKGAGKAVFVLGAQYVSRELPLGLSSREQPCLSSFPLLRYPMAGFNGPN